MGTKRKKKQSEKKVRKNCDISDNVTVSCLTAAALQSQIPRGNLIRAFLEIRTVVKRWHVLGG